MQKPKTYPNPFILALFLLSLGLISACEKTLDTADPKQSFTKIYNESSYSDAITALDIVETDSGYLVLATKQVTDQQFPGVSLLAIDKEGKVVKQTDLDSIYVSPAKGFFRSGTNYRFLCMDANTTFAYMMEVSKQGSFVQSTQLNVSYPLCIGLANNGSYLIQGYSQASRLTILANLSTSLNQNWISTTKNNFQIFESVDEQVFGHLSLTGKRYPFSVGQTSNGLYYFNGFRNFTFSLVFVNSSDQSFAGVVNGYQYSGGLSSVLPLDGNNFAISRFYFGDNYINPKVALVPTPTIASKDIDGRHILELEPDARVSLNKFTLSGKSVLIYASNTINKQIVLYVYDQNSGALINTKYFGLSVPLEFGALVPTEDGGLLITGSAYVDSRFKRICAIKLAKSQLDDLVN